MAISDSDDEQNISNHSNSLSILSNHNRFSMRTMPKYFGHDEDYIHHQNVLKRINQVYGQFRAHKDDTNVLQDMQSTQSTLQYNFIIQFLQS